MARYSLSSRSSYAAPLKAKPTDCHLEFSMNDQILPLDLTIYGAINQLEMRKTGAMPLNTVWQMDVRSQIQEDPWSNSQFGR